MKPSVRPAMMDGSTINNSASPVRSVEAASLYSGVQRWKTLAQGKLMPASTYTGYYLTQIPASVAALLWQICPVKEKKL